MKTKALRDATIITFVMLLVSIVGIEAKGHETWSASEDCWK